MKTVLSTGEIYPVDCIVHLSTTGTRPAYQSPSHSVRSASEPVSWFDLQSVAHFLLQIPQSLYRLHIAQVFLNM